MAIYCALSGKLKQAVAASMVKILNEQGNKTIEDLMKSVWTSEVSELQEKYNKGYLLNLEASIPEIIIDYSRYEGDTEFSKNTYKVFKEKITDLDNVYEVNKKYSQNNWIEVIASLLGVSGMKRVSVQEQKVLNEAFSIPVQNVDVDAQLGDILVDLTPKEVLSSEGQTKQYVQAYRVVEIQDDYIVAENSLNANDKQAFAKNQLSRGYVDIADTEIELSLYGENKIHKTHNIPSDIIPGSVVQIKMKRTNALESKDPEKQKNFYLNVFVNNHEVGTIARGQYKDNKLVVQKDEASVMSIMTNNMTIKDENDFNPVFGVVTEVNRDPESKSIKFNLISPLYYGRKLSGTSYEKTAAAEASVIGEFNDIIVDGHDMHTASFAFQKIASTEPGTGRYNVQKNTYGPMHSTLCNNVLEQINEGNKPKIGNKEIYLRTFRESEYSSNVMLKIVDEDNNSLRFSIQNNDLIIDENGQEIIFALESLPTLNSKFNEQLGIKSYNETTLVDRIVTLLKHRYQPKESEYQAKEVQDRILDEMRIVNEIKSRVLDKDNPQDFTFEITGASFVLPNSRSYKTCIPYNGEKIKMDMNQGSPTAGYVYTSFYGAKAFMAHGPLSEGFVDYIDALLFEENLVDNKGNIISFEQRNKLFGEYFSKNNSPVIQFKLNGEPHELRLVSNNKGNFLKFDNNVAAVLQYNIDGTITRNEQYKDKIDKMRQFLIGALKSGSTHQFAEGFGNIQMHFSSDVINNGEINISEFNKDTKTITLNNISIEQCLTNNGFKPKITGVDSHGYLTYKIMNVSSKPIDTLQYKEEGEEGLSFDKTIIAKMAEESATAEQMQEALEWFNNSPISKGVSFKEMFDVVNTTVVADWKLNAIRLMNGSDYSDVYHESWHQFSQYYLDKNQKEDLYNEVRSKKGTFKDHKGNVLEFSNASDEQCEEYLAEAFRSYMLNNKTNEKGKIKKFLQKIKFIIDWVVSSIKEAIGMSNSVSQIDVMFEKLRVGNFIGLNKSSNNVMFDSLNKSIYQVGSKEKLNPQTSSQLLTLVDGFMMDYINFMQTNSIINIDNVIDAIQNNKKTESEDYKKFKEICQAKVVVNESKIFTPEQRQKAKETLSNIKITKAIDVVSLLSDPQELKKAYKYIYSSVLVSKDIAEFLENKCREKGFDKLKSEFQWKKILLSQALINFGDINTLGLNKEGRSEGIIGTHARQSKFFKNAAQELIKSEYEDDEEELMEKLRDLYDRNPNEKSIEDYMDDNLRFLLSTLPGYELDLDGNYIPDINDFGYQKPKDFFKVKNMLINLLHNSVNKQEMINKLVVAAKTNPIIKSLVTRMGELEMTEDFVSERNRVQLWNKFFNVFCCSETKHIMVNVNVEKTTDQNKEKITNLTVHSGEMSGPSWKIEDYYVSKFIDYNSIYDKENKYINDTPSSNFVNIKNILEDFKTLDSIKREPIKFLHACGIYLTPHNDIKNELKLDIYEEKFKALYDYLVGLSKKNKNTENTLISNPIEQIFKSNVNLSLFLNDIKNLDLLYTENVNIEMIRNAEGSVEYRNQQNNSITILLNHLNACETYDDVLNDPALKHLDIFKYKYEGDNPTKELNPHYNPYAAHSEFLIDMFQLKFTSDGKKMTGFGRKRYNARIDAINFSGIKIQTEDRQQGIKLFDADKQTKAITDLSLYMNSAMENMRHADKATSYGLSYSKARILNEPYETRLDVLINQTASRMYDYLKADIDRIERIISNTNNQNEELNKMCKKNSEIFGVFDKILTQKTKDAIIDSISSKDKKIEETILSQAIQSDIKSYLQSKIDENTNIFSSILFENGVEKFPGLLSSFKESINKVNKRHTQLPEVKDNVFDVLVSNFTVDNLLYNIECICLVYGDVMQYNHAKEDFTKRIGAFGSTGKIFDDSESTRNDLDGIIYNTSYIEEHKDELHISSNTYAATGEHQGELLTSVCEDVTFHSVYFEEYKKIVGEKIAKDYDEIKEESNAQGLISFDAYRMLKWREGEWTQEQERLFQKINKGEEVNPEDVKKFFPVYKLQYIGPLRTSGMPLTAFHKYSLMPLVPTMIKGKNLEKVHKRMMQEGVSYITFKSGSKLSENTSNQSLPQLYDTSKIDAKERKNEDGTYNARTLNKDLINDFDGTNRFFNENYIPIAYLKDQVVIHDELEGETILATQFKRLVENNLFDAGYPVDIFDEATDKEAAKKEWIEHSNDEEWKKKKSNYYRLATQFEKTISNLTRFALDSIKRDLGLNIKDEKRAREKLMSFIEKELDKKDIPSFALEGITDARELQFSFYANQVENIIMSLINKRIIRQKIHGEQLIQVAGTLWETFGTEENPAIVDESSNELGFYKVLKDENIKPAQCKIPLSGEFVNLLNLKEVNGSLEKLNELLKDKEWRAKNKEFITIVAARIPVQGHNSMELLEIQEFLAPGSNNIIVCPSELVIKSGGDYDVDKLTTILPSISLINGKPVVVKPIDEYVDVNKINKELKDLEKSLEERNEKLELSTRKAFAEIVNNQEKYDEGLISTIKNFLERIQEIQERIASNDAIINNEESDTLSVLKAKESNSEIKYLRDNMWDEIFPILKGLNPKLQAKEKKIEDIKNRISELRIKLLSASQLAYENQLLEDAVNILQLPINSESLLTPNQSTLYTNEVDGPATLIAKRHTISEQHSPTSVIEYGYNLSKHDDFNVGKTILGPAAIDNVFSSIIRRVGAHMNAYSVQTTNGHIFPEFFNAHHFKNAEVAITSINDVNREIKLIEEDIQILNNLANKNQSAFDNTIFKYQNLSNKDVAKYRQLLKKEHKRLLQYARQTLKLKHNTVVVNGEECIDISRINDAYNDNTINEAISEYITGCVDVAKGAWIKDIQGNMEVIPTFMFLIQSGVSVKDACYFVCNPAVVRYVTLKQNNASTSNLLINRNDNLNGEIRCRAVALGIEDVSGYNNEELNKLVYEKIRMQESYSFDWSGENIKNLVLSSDGTITDKDLIVLAEFIRAEDMASSINALKLAVRVDASKNNNVFNVMDKQEKFLSIEDDQKIPSEILSKIKSETVISSFFILDDIKQIVNSILPYRIDDTVLDFAKSSLDYNTLQKLDNSNDLEQNIIRFQNEFINYLWQQEFKLSDDDSIRELTENDKNTIGRIYPDFIESDIVTSPDNASYLNNIYNTLLDTIQKYKEGFSKSYIAQLYEKINKETVNFGNPFSLFAITTAMHRAGVTDTIFKTNQFDIAFEWKTVCALIEQNCPKLFYSMDIFKSIKPSVTNRVSVEKLKSFGEEKVKRTVQQSTNLNFISEVDNNMLEVLHANLKLLTDKEALKQELKRKTRAQNENMLTDFDIEYIVDFFSYLSDFSILQSGLSASVRNSLNAMFGQNFQFKNLIDKFNSKTEKEKNIILEQFFFNYKKHWNKSNLLRYQNHSYDNFTDGAFLYDEDEVEVISRKSENSILCHSGGAIGSDTLWGDACKRRGIPTNHYYYQRNKFDQKPPQGNTLITKEEYLLGRKKVYQALQVLRRKEESAEKYMHLTARDYTQVYNSDVVFAIGTLSNNIVDGGTGYAVQMAISEGKPVYVYDYKAGKWFFFTGEKWMLLKETPSIPVGVKNFAGIGSRLNNATTGQKNKVTEEINKVLDTSYFGKDYKKSYLYYDLNADFIKSNPNTLFISTSKKIKKQYSNLVSLKIDKDGSIEEIKEVFDNAKKSIERLYKSNMFEYIAFDNILKVDLTESFISKYPKEIQDEIRKQLEDLRKTAIKESVGYISSIHGTIHKRLEELQDMLNSSNNDNFATQTQVKNLKDGVDIQNIRKFFNDNELQLIHDSIESTGKFIINSASRHSDAAMFSKKIINEIEANSMYEFGSPKRMYALEVWSKHDGKPMRDILKACHKNRVAPIVSFSVTTLGGSVFEPGVMKWEDMRDKIAAYIDEGLIDPATTTIRIDPIVPGLTKQEDVKDAIEQFNKLGITKFVVSMMQSYGSTDGLKGFNRNGLPKDRGVVRIMQERGYDFKPYYDIDKSGKFKHFPKENVTAEWGAFFNSIIKEHNNSFDILSCSTSMGLKPSACLDPNIIQHLIQSVDFDSSSSEERNNCKCPNRYGDMLTFNDKCWSSCGYCYYAHGQNNALKYYDEEGNLLTDNPEEAHRLYEQSKNISRETTSVFGTTIYESEALNISTLLQDAGSSENYVNLDYTFPNDERLRSFALDLSEKMDLVRIENNETMVSSEVVEIINKVRNLDDLLLSLINNSIDDIKNEFYKASKLDISQDDKIDDDELNNNINNCK